MSETIRYIAIVGSGNVASYMGRLFRDKGYNISAVISRNTVSGAMLASSTGAEFSNDISASIDADLVMLCVNDDQIGNASQALNAGPYIVCHCAGSREIGILEKHQSRAVIYPLQSIKKDMPVMDIEVPFLLESNDSMVGDSIARLMEACGTKFYQADSGTRLAYHLAAVFANNFTNAMLMAAHDLAHQHRLDISLLQPLIKETFGRLDNMHFEQLQTGPARRNDQASMRKHLDLLVSDKQMLEVYKAVSDYIRNKFDHQG